MHLSEQPLVSAHRIEQRIGELAHDISARYGSEEIVLVCVLKGALVFTSDLVRALHTPARIEFVRALSYDGKQSTGKVEVTLVGDPPLAGRHVLVVEDILDTGRTTLRVLERLRDEGPASLAVCVLLNKPSARIEAIKADFTGFDIGDKFVVGYGLDYNERYRDLA